MQAKQWLSQKEADAFAAAAAMSYRVYTRPSGAAAQRWTYAFAGVQYTSMTKLVAGMADILRHADATSETVETAAETTAETTAETEPRAPEPGDTLMETARVAVQTLKTGATDLPVLTACACLALVSAAAVPWVLL